VSAPILPWAACVRRALRCVLAILLIAAASPALAQAAPAAAGAAAAPSAANSPRGAPLIVNNRTVFVFRGTVFGATAEDRAEASASRLEVALTRCAVLCDTGPLHLPPP